MKAMLFAMFVGLLIVGCGDQAQKEAEEGESKQKNRPKLIIGLSQRETQSK